MPTEKSSSSNGQRLKAAIAWLFSPPMKRSSIGFLIALVLGFVSMGMTGVGLFFVVTPALNFLLGLNIPMDMTGIDQLKGKAMGADAMWPTIILVSMLWSVGFLIAGLVTSKLARVGLANLVKKFLYILILLTWALCLWVFAIKVGFVQ
jgi:hypothetical protein